MTIREIAMLGKDFHDNYYTKYHHYVEKTYKYRGENKVCKTLEMTKEGCSIMMGKALNTKVFICPSCGEKISFNELEYWGEDIKEVIANKIPCSLCYEEEMGDNL